MHLTRLVYASNHGGITKDTLHQILKKSRITNKADGITGLLVAGEEDFLQLLEGRRADVAKCFKRIISDVRHRHVRVLLANSIDARSCEQWNMHCVELKSIDPEIVGRYWIDGSFNPDEMTDVAIEGLCKDLADAA